MPAHEAPIGHSPARIDSRGSLVIIRRLRNHRAGRIVAPAPVDWASVERRQGRTRIKD
jgi:hypothetical protein